MDAATGEVLSHREKERKPAGGKTLDGLFEEMERGRSEAEETFEREVAAMKDRDRLLEEKFREAMLAGDWDTCVAMGRDQVHEAPRHRDVGHIGRPDLIRAINDQISQ